MPATFTVPQHVEHHVPNPWQAMVLRVPHVPHLPFSPLPQLSSTPAVGRHLHFLKWVMRSLATPQHPSPRDFLPSRIFFPVFLLLKKVSMTVIPSPFWVSNPCSLLITTTLPTRSFKYTHAPSNTHTYTHTVSMTFVHLPFHFSRGLQTGLHLIFTVAKLSGC